MKEREVSDVATLKAIADPMRLAILNVLMKSDPEPLSVKEIAARLDESPTKLYRHVKQLEQVELIRVGETRLVSGIVESRYLSAQTGLRLSPEVFSDGGDSPRPEALGAMLATLNLLRTDFQRDFLNGRIDMTPRQDGSPQSPGMLRHATMRIRPERLARLRDRLAALVAELDSEGESTDPDAVDVTLFSLLYARKPAETGQEHPTPAEAGQDRPAPGDRQT